jgi:uncharacterized protein YbaP (TraB family)
VNGEVRRISTRQAGPSAGCPSRRLVTGIVLSLLVSCAASAAAAQAPVEQRKTFLWAIASPTATVHLLGSVHLVSPDVYPLDSRIEAAFQRATTVVFETAMDPASQLAAGQKMARAGTYPAGDSIDRHLDRETLELLRQRLGRSGASLDAVRSFRPWFVALVLSLEEMRRLGYHSDLGIDIHFVDKARDRKRVLGLETVDEQVALFAGMTEGVQTSVLRESLGKLDELGTLMRKTQQLWRAGDARGIDALLVAPLRRDFPDVYQRLFLDRNRKMAAAIEGYLKTSGEYFVVVGAGHLVGAEGILNLLQGRGYAPVQQ